MRVEYCKTCRSMEDYFYMQENVWKVIDKLTPKKTEINTCRIAMSPNLGVKFQISLFSSIRRFLRDFYRFYAVSKIFTLFDILNLLVCYILEKQPRFECLFRMITVTFLTTILVGGSCFWLVNVSNLVNWNWLLNCRGAVFKTALCWFFDE